MRQTDFHKAKVCGLEQKRNLIESLRACEFCTDSIDELRACYSETARTSGENARDCIGSWHP